MRRVFKRVAAWNNARYERVYDQALTVALLREEQREWLEATTPVDKLDALCDLVYVAIGALWKRETSSDELEHAQLLSMQLVHNHLDCDALYPAMYNSVYIDAIEFDDEYPDAMSLQMIITSSVAEMTGLGLDREQCIEALLIVCDSNDSKTITKTASNVKANVDKGHYFVAPEPRLTALLEVARGKLN